MTSRSWGRAMCMLEKHPVRARFGKRAERGTDRAYKRAGGGEPDRRVSG